MRSTLGRLLSVAVTALGGPAVGQTTYTWDPSRTGAQSWSAAGESWSTNGASPYTTAWANGDGTNRAVIDVGTDGLSLTATTDVQLNQLTLAPAAGATGSPIVTLAVSPGTTAPPGSITLTGTAPTITVTGVSATISAPLAGTTGLVKAGAGRLTLTGTNTYTGGTTIQAGTIMLSGNGSIVGDVAVTGSTAGLELNRSGATYTFGGSVSGVGALVVSSGNVTLTGNNTHTGGTYVQGGSATVGSATALGAAGSTLRVYGSLDLNGYSQTVGQVQSLSGGVIRNTSATAVNLSIGTGMTSAQAVGFVGNVTQTAGTISLAKAGAGTLYLGGTNTHTGGTDVQAGTLVFTTAGAVGGTGAGITAAAGTTVGVGFAVDQAFLNRITAAGPITLGVGASTSNALDLSALPDGTALTALRNTSLSSTNFSPIVLSGSLTPAGSTYRLASQSTSAPLRVATGLADGAAARALAVTGGLVELTAANSLTGGTTVASGATLSVGVGGTAGTLGGAVANAGTLRFNRSDDATFAGTLSGAGTIYKDGAGALLLAGANQHTGALSVTAGTVRLGNAGALGSGSVSVSSGATVDLNGFGPQVSGFSPLAGGTVTNTAAAAVALTLAGSNSVNGTITQAAGAGAVSVTVAGSLFVRGDQGYSGRTTVNTGGVLWLGGGLASSELVNNGTVWLDRTGSYTLAASISGSGLVRTSATGTITLTGDNTFSGGLVIGGSGSQVGTVKVGSATALGAVASTVPFTVDTRGRLDLNGYSVSTQALRGNKFTGDPGAVVTNSAAAPVTLTVGSGSAAGATLGTMNGTLTQEAVAGALSVVKTGGGTWVLAAANSHAGGTRVEGGLLAVQAGGALGTGGLTLAGGTLQFSGAGVTAPAAPGALTIAGTATVQFSSPGALTDLTFSGLSDTSAAGSVLTVQGWQGTSTGATAGPRLLFTGLGANPNATYAGLLSKVQFQGAAGLGGLFIPTGTAGTVQLVPTPEPGAVGLLAAAGLGLIGAARRRLTPASRPAA